ncbi:MAG: DUF1992 domain-containing protein [Ilumatobacter sp.]|nr:DUF1992 domain-containing protein [Ilumatobacter sp.]
MRAMSWVARMVEQRLADAARAGELDAGPLEGKPIPGIDEHRPDGWWAEQFVRRELSHDRRKVAVEAAAKACVAYWKADSEADVVALVRAANEAITAATRRQSFAWHNFDVVTSRRGRVRSRRAGRWSPRGRPTPAAVRR